MMYNSYQQLNKKGAIFIAVWCMVNVIQALFTELHFDEAYYSLFADHLAWGYFDHPPLIALLVRIGSELIGGSLGIRLVCIILLPFALWLFWESLPKQEGKDSDPLFFLLIAASIPYIQIVGFVATPDAPLLFGYALILFAYQAFNKREGVWETLLLALGLALAMYSKYHAALFILLLIGSNPRLLLRPRFYLAGALALALYLPHLWWESQHDWVSIRYHLFERNRAFQWGNIIEYLWNIPVSYNPLLSIPFVYYWIRQKSGGKIERALRVVVPGFWIFFFFSTFRGHTQPQWMLPLSFGMIWTLYRAGMESPKAKRVITLLGKISVVVFIIVRILLICNLKVTANIGFSQNKNSYTELAALTQGAPLIFDSKYNRASHYLWYSKMPTHSQGSVYHRNSQFSILQFDEAFYGEEVWVQCPDSLPKMRLPNRYYISLKKVNFFIPVSGITIEPAEPIGQVPAGDSITLTIKIENRYSFPFPLTQAQGTRLHAVWKTKHGVVLDDLLPNMEQSVDAGATITRSVTIKTPELPDSYRLGFSVERPPMKYGFTTPPKKVKVI